MNELTTFSPKTCSLTKVDNPLDADARTSLPSGPGWPCITQCECAIFGPMAAPDTNQIKH